MKLLKYKKNKGSSFFSWGFNILDLWLTIKQQGKSLSEYFEDNLVQTIAIYGLGTLGKRLYEELRNTQIDISYGIDQNAEKIQIDGLEIKTLQEELAAVDIIVVTPMSFYEIEQMIRRKMGIEINIVSIEDVVEYCAVCGE